MFGLHAINAYLIFTYPIKSFEKCAITVSVYTLWYRSVDPVNQTFI